MRAATLGMMSILVLATSGASQGHYEIALPETWRGEEPPMAPAEGWWGLFVNGDGTFLRPVTVHVALENGSDLGEAGRSTGRSFKVAGDAQPRVLIRGLKEPMAGLLPTGAVAPGSTWVRDVKEPYRYINPGETLHLVLDGEREGIRISALAEVKEEPEFHQVMVYNYELRLYQGREDETRSQSLFKLTQIRDLGEPRLVWAGDLDRDGRMDFLFDISDHYIVTHLTLYLSTVAEEGEFVGLVAEWKTAGC